MHRPTVRLGALLAAAMSLGCPDPSSGPTDHPSPTDGVVDMDQDGYPDAAAGGTDCDDADPAVHPGAGERCGGGDENCDGLADVGAVDATSWYPDADGDGYGVDDLAVDGCAGPSGSVVNAGDCDDANDAIHPAAPDLCNGVDDDCDAATVEAAQIDGVSYATLALALDAATDGATVEVCDGVWEPVAPTAIGADLTIRPATGTLGSVTLDGGTAGTLFQVDGGHALTLESLVIVGARTSAVVGAVGSAITIRDSQLERNRGEYGAAVNGYDITLSDSTLSDNQVTLQGGAVYAAVGGNLVVTGSELFDNFAVNDGGAIETWAPTILDTVTLRDNQSSNYGGGLRSWGPTLDLVATTISGNHAWRGGGIGASDVVATADADTVFAGNTSTGEGGGLYVYGYYLSASWTGGSFVANDGGMGGGIYAAAGVGAPMLLSEVYLEGNFASVSGGGAYLYGSPVTFTDSVSVENQTPYGGGGMSMNFGAPIATHVQRVTLVDNFAGYGGASDTWRGDGLVEDCIATGNVADMGGGFYVDAGTLLVVNRTDLGTDPIDNAPEDVYVLNYDSADSPAEYSGYGTDASFVCDSLVPSCE